MFEEAVANIVRMLEQFKHIAAITWLASTIWVALNRKKIAYHLNDIKFLAFISSAIDIRRYCILFLALTPEYSLLNIVFFLIWFCEIKSYRHSHWILTRMRIQFRLYERALVQREGIEGLTKRFETVVKEASRMVEVFEPGTRKYDLAVNFYIKCKRRLEKMRDGKKFGHFPLPE